MRAPAGKGSASHPALASFLKTPIPMQHDTSSRTGGDTDMHLRRITLPDGRYMIFYTFDDSPAMPARTGIPGDTEEDEHRDAPENRSSPGSEEKPNV